ncbi:YaaR family protein [Desulfotomaculum sp. 1211_IL3151]|uniref:YaaR family protein n=1 Tax=Desulfotomaculum sp. 1211_IL3151 TaxID=3084055 RepID=UPI002FD9A3A4
MKISAISSNKQNDKSRAATGSLETSKAKQVFSKVLENEEKDYAHKQLQELLDKVSVAGDNLKSAVTEENVRQYKDSIKDYLTFVLKNYHKLRHDRSINYSTFYTRVEIINREVEELTVKLLGEEKDNIDAVAEVDRIAGLIIDVYM